MPEKKRTVWGRALGLAIGPLLAATPAAASPTTDTEGCGAPGYAGAASADLLRLDALDLHPLGLPVGEVAQVRLASSRARPSGPPPQSVAAPPPLAPPPPGAVPPPPPPPRPPA